MKKRIGSLLLVLCLLLTLLGGCGSAGGVLELVDGLLDAALSEAETGAESGGEQTQEQTEGGTPASGELPAEDGIYTSPEEVALYLHVYGCLPQNFITKDEARTLGWDSREGNLWDVAPGMSIGGDRFGNYEGLLPDGDYTECDVNYSGGWRGGERLVFSSDGAIYYTADHYESFTQLY